MHELVKIDLPTDKPSNFKLITFIETLATIRNLLNQSIIQIEIIEKLMEGSDNSLSCSDDGSAFSEDDSACSDGDLACSDGDIASSDGDLASSDDDSDSDDSDDEIVKPVITLIKTVNTPEKKRSSNHTYKKK
jgi:hypothetical protein